MARNQVLYPRTQVGTPVGAFISSASYIIDKNGSTINAINGATSAIDYTGTDAKTVINAAIVALNAIGGGTVFIKAGTFTITNTIDLKSNVNIIGEGYNTLLQVTDTSLTSPTLRVAGTDANNHITDVILENFRVKSVGSSYFGALGQNPRGIYIRLATRVKVQNLWVENTVSSSMTLDECTDCIAIGCYFNDTGYNCIGVGEENVVNCRIIGCSMYGALAGAGIASNSTQGGCVFIGNAVDGCYNGIYAQDYNSAQVIGTIISNNIIKNCTNRGIVVNSATNINISGNYIYNCLDAGIGLVKGYSPTTDSIVIEGNVVSGNKYQGIIVDTCYGVSVSNNICKTTVFSSGNNGAGIYIKNSNACSLIGNISHDNQGSGFTIEQSPYITIVGNQSFNNGQNDSSSDGIKFVDSGTPCQYCSIVSNQLYDNQGAGKTQRNGLYLANSTDYCLVTDNIVTPNKTTGINVGSGTHNIVRNNSGYVTENSGVATVISGQTSIAVTHGLGYTPTDGDIVVTPTNSMGSATKFYVGTYTSTQFTITVDQDPGATTAIFAWMARKN
jgi:parallel beta-helix repeat protein